MAKRYTDTEKWKKESFCELSLKMKVAWVYICDNCDHAGIWDANFRLMSFQIGEQVTREEIDATFSDKIKWIADKKVYVQSFIEFQYGTLNPTNRVHQSVILRHESLGLIKPLASSLEGAKDKDKDKDKDTVLLKSTKEHSSDTRAKSFTPPTIKETVAYFQSNDSTEQEANKFYNHYESNGWMVGRNKMKSWTASAKNWMSGRFLSPQSQIVKPKAGGFGGAVIY